MADHHGSYYTKDSAIIRHRDFWFRSFMFPAEPEQKFEAIRNFPLNDEDIMITSFPKSGTSWVMHIIWLVLNGVDAEADERLLSSRFPHLEHSATSLEELAKQKSPRLLMSHMPYGYLPVAVDEGRGKVIYIARNAKDVCVSFYHFHRMMYRLEFRGNFSDFYHLFKTGRVGCGPWQDHVSGFWDHRCDKNILFLFYMYEDLHQQCEATVRRIAEFLECPLTAQQCADIARRSHFSVMKNNPTANYSWLPEQGRSDPSKGSFMRKGVVGDWRNYFTSEMAAEIHQCCIEPLERRGIVFTDSLEGDPSQHSPTAPAE